MAFDRLGEYRSPYAAAQALGRKLGVGAETLQKWIVQAQVDGGQRSGPTSQELAEIRRLRAENRDLKEANEILQANVVASTGVVRRTGHVASIRSRCFKRSEGIRRPSRGR